MQQRRRLTGRARRPLTAIMAATALVASSIVAINHSETILRTDTVAADPINASEETVAFDSGDNVVVDDAAVSGQGESGSRTVKEFHRDDEFSMFALTWNGAKDFVAHFRGQNDDGSWGDWFEAEPLSEKEGDKNGTELIYLAPTKAVQVSVTNLDLISGAPTNLDAVFIDGNATGGAQPGIDLAADSDGLPKVISRSAWGANEAKRCSSPTYDDHVSAITVHHTAGSNNYSPAQAAAQVRGIYHYHAQTLGWCDIGYNALVDKYGNIYEGRYGGLNKAVQGAHAGGFNQNTWGVSMIGDYTSITPPKATIEALGKLAGWRASVAGFDPSGHGTHISEGTHYTKYRKGTAVDLPNIFAHRDVGLTTCPGDAGYAQMGTIRSIAKKTYDAITTGTITEATTDNAKADEAERGETKTEETKTEGTTSTSETTTAAATTEPSTSETSTSETTTSATTTETTTSETTTSATSTREETPSSVETTTEVSTTKEPTADEPSTADTTATDSPAPINGATSQNSSKLFERALKLAIDFINGKPVDQNEALELVGSLLALVLQRSGIDGLHVTKAGNLPVLNELHITDLPVFVPEVVDLQGDSAQAQKYREVLDTYGRVLGDARGGIHYASPSHTYSSLSYVPFSNGVIVSSPETGTHALWGAFADAWARSGFDAGALGLPLNEQYQHNGVYRVDFEHGFITVDPSTGKVDIRAV